MLQPEFFAASARWLVDAGTPLLAGVHRDGALVAALPMVARGPLWQSLTTHHSPRYDVVGAGDAVPVLWETLRNAGWTRLTLDRVPVFSPLANDVVALARDDGARVVVDPGARSPYVALDGLESKLPGPFRRKLRSRWKKVVAPEFERVTRHDPSALADAFDIEAAAWKADAGTAIVCDTRLVGFYSELAERGQLSLSFLRSGEQRIACHLALEDERRYYLLKPGYDPAYRRLGPGHLLIREVVRDAARRGLQELDFLGHQMDWKRSWSETTRDHVKVTIYAPTTAGRLLYAIERCIRPAAGRALRVTGLRGRYRPPRDRHG